MPDRSSRWHLDRFLEELDLWAEREAPHDDLLLVLTAWIMTRDDDPYLGVRRQNGFENLWFGAVPETDNGDSRLVACSYWIVESTHTVRCNSFATLALPF